MQQFSRVAPCFAVADVGATIQWYETNLGFHGFAFPKDAPHAFACLVREGVEIMLQRIDDYQKPDLYHLRGDAGVWDAYIRMEGVREFYEAIRERVEILRQLEKQFYGDWEFEVKDPNGYVLVFSELID